MTIRADRTRDRYMYMRGRGRGDTDMHSWRWFDQWISSSERGVESYLFFLRDRQEVTRVSQWEIR